MARQATNDGQQHTFAKIDRAPRLSDVVAEAVLNRIIAEELRPDDPLPSERELCEQFGVSRTVVREAMRALVAKGVVEARSGSGLRVAAVAPSTVSESLTLFLRGGGVDFGAVQEVRRMVEIEMSGLAAERAQADDVAELERLHVRLRAAEDDLEATAQADVDFHARIARASGNELLPILLEPLGAALLEIRRTTLAAGSFTETVADHERILRAIAAGDARTARDAMRTHLDNVGARLAQMPDAATA